MGRLTDNILAVFGVEPSDRVTIATPTSKPSLSNHSSNETPQQHVRSKNTSKSVLLDEAQVDHRKNDSWSSYLESLRKDIFDFNHKNQKVSKVMSTSSTTDGQASNQETMLQAAQSPSVAGGFEAVDPITEGSETEFQDCLSCKVIGTSAACGAGLYVAHATRKGAPKYTGASAVVFRFQGTLLSFTLMGLGICRMMNVGPFSPARIKFTFTDHIKQDCRDFCDLFGLEHPAFLKETNTQENSYAANDE